jgi:hypothetical protein
MKIYKLYANYEDYDTSSMITIGVFSDYEKALAVKKKWSMFHENGNYPSEIFRNFTEITIDEYNLDEDRFAKSGNWNKNIKSELESFDRNYKINSILFDDDF